MFPAKILRRERLTPPGKAAALRRLPPGMFPSPPCVFSASLSWHGDTASHDNTYPPASPPLPCSTVLPGFSPPYPPAIRNVLPPERHPRRPCNAAYALQCEAAPPYKSLLLLLPHFPRNVSFRCPVLLPLPTPPHTLPPAPQQSITLAPNRQPALPAPAYPATPEGYPVHRLPNPLPSSARNAIAFRPPAAYPFPVFLSVPGCPDEAVLLPVYFFRPFRTTIDCFLCGADLFHTLTPLPPRYESPGE